MQREKPMPIFKAPVYAKLSVDGGASVPCYTFDIEYLASDKEDHLTSVADRASDLSLATLNELIKENHAWWSRLIQGFMTASAKLFSKTYSLDQLNRITKHVLPSPLPSITDYPSTLFWTVRQIKIYGGSLYVHWGITSEPIQIDLPDTPTLSPRVDLSTAAKVPVPISTPPVSTPLVTSHSLPDELEEVDVKDLPVKDMPATATLDRSREYDRQRVKEAHLKAKLAMYKAQYQMRLYYEKYGREYSDSESDSEYEDEEEYDQEEEDEYEEDEDVQL